jgi:hypothetical protein
VDELLVHATLSNVIVSIKPMALIRRRRAFAVDDPFISARPLLLDRTVDMRLSLKPFGSLFSSFNSRGARIAYVVALLESSKNLDGPDWLPNAGSVGSPRL